MSNLEHVELFERGFCVASSRQKTAVSVSSLSHSLRQWFFNALIWLVCTSAASGPVFQVYQEIADHFGALRRAQHVDRAPSIETHDGPDHPRHRLLFPAQDRDRPGQEFEMVSTPK